MMDKNIEQEEENKEEENHIKYLNDNGSIKISLSCPIKVGCEEVKSLIFNRLNARKMRAMDSEKGEIGKGIVLIAKSANIPVFSVEQLDYADFAKISEALESFLSSSPKTGKK